MPADASSAAGNQVADCRAEVQRAAVRLADVLAHRQSVAARPAGEPGAVRQADVWAHRRPAAVPQAGAPREDVQQAGALQAGELRVDVPREDVQLVAGQVCCRSPVAAPVYRAWQRAGLDVSPVYRA